MHDLIGRWSTHRWYPNDPQDEVLVFLPDGTGVFEYSWWRLTSYETFTYTVAHNQLTITSTAVYDDADGTKHVERAVSQRPFMSAFVIKPADDQAATGYAQVLVFEQPYSFAHITKLGRTADDAIAGYTPPRFTNMENPEHEEPR